MTDYKPVGTLGRYADVLAQGERHGMNKRFASGFHAPDERYRMPMKRCDVAIVYDNGVVSTEPVNLLDQFGNERRIIAFLVDGKPYKPESPDERWDIGENGTITAITLGDARYEKVDE